jgi:N-acetylglucosaminyldiphosphoundecaprenol N-acetyl-beta-D-mannosaminyltransferase
MGGNSHHVYTAFKNPEYAKICRSSWIFFPDGQSIILASFLIGAKLPERIAGPDVMMKILEECERNRLKVFLLGCDEQFLVKLKSNLSRSFPTAIAGGYSPPFGVWSEEENNKIVSKINDSNADILFMGISLPKQDIWVFEHKDKLRTKIAIGFGAAFDFHSGRVKRAPVWMQKICLEWFHRFLQEPKRMWKRYIFANSYLIFLVVKLLAKRVLPKKK